jgi:hypothetical protein
MGLQRRRPWSNYIIPALVFGMPLLGLGSEAKGWIEHELNPPPIVHVHKQKAPPPNIANVPQGAHRTTGPSNGMTATKLHVPHMPLHGGRGGRLGRGRIIGRLGNGFPPLFDGGDGGSW